MKEKQKLKNARGITLVALVVIIIVLIILAGVSINMVLGQNGIITQAKEAKEKTLNAEAHEKEQMNEVVDYIKNNGASSGNNSSKELISKDESYVGYYADVDGDGTVDGVIYADLAIGGSGTWGALNESFSYDAITGTKDYYISKKNYEGSFGTEDVLTATGNGADRFYVVALEDFNEGTQYCWYDAAESASVDSSDTTTASEFGAGKTNTAAMINNWNNSTWGVQNDNETYLDMWGVIQDKVKEGWFVPSSMEWVALAGNLTDKGNGLSGLKLSTFAWTSAGTPTYVNYINFIEKHMGFNRLIDGYVNYSKCSSALQIRLSITF